MLFLKILFFTIISVVCSTAADYQTMRCPDIMAYTKMVSAEDPVFEQEEHAHTLRTIDHLLHEQKAEVACIASFTSCKSKMFFVSPPYMDIRRNFLHLRQSISLLANNFPSQEQYIKHSFYIYMLERLLL